MTSTMFMLQAAAAGAVAAILLLRYAWSRPRRSVPLNGAAWVLLLAAVVLSAAAAGAWGVAITSLVATFAAALCLAQAALMAPAGKANASNRRANMLPQMGEPMHIGRRFVTFLITVPGAFLTVLIVSVASRGLTGPLGWHEADANVLSLFLVPVLWCILATLLLIWPGRRTQLLLLVIPAIVGGLVLALTGQMA